MAIIRPPNSHRRKYYVHHGTPGNFQYCRLSWGCKTNIFSLSAKTFISSPQMFTPAMGFYSQTCKRAKDLAFHSRPGTLEMNLFLYLFLLTEHFVAEKERCSVQIHQRGRSEMGSVWYLAKVQAPCYSTQLFRVRLKILRGKNFWEKNSSCTLESTAILLLIKQTALWKHQLCSAETNLLEIDTCSFFEK